MGIQTKKFQASLLRWSAINLRKFPWRKKKISPYKIFLAEMLLKRTTAKAASTVFPKLLKKYPSVKKLAAAKQKDLVGLIAPIGYQQRSKEMVAAAKYIVKNYRSNLPDDKVSLVKVPYIGDYTSSAILSMAFNKPEPMVDSNANRVISRVFYGRNPPAHITAEIRKSATSVLPKGKHREFNLAILDVGGTLCYPREPKCYACPFEKICKFNNNGGS